MKDLATEKDCRVRVIILNYNQPEITLKCINNVLAQLYSPLDIVVVDNASSPKNSLLLEQGVPNQVTLLKNPINSGYAAGNNYGIKNASHLKRPEFVLILNNDAFFRDSHTISKLVTAITTSDELVAVSPIVNNGSYSGSKTTPFASVQVRRDADYLSCIVSYSWFLRRLPFLKFIADNHIYQDKIPYAENQKYKCESINGSCFLIKTAILEEIGYLDENTFLYFEEIILGKQLKIINKKCCLLTSVVIDHYQGTSTGQRVNAIKWKLHKELIKSQLYYIKTYLNAGIIKQSLLIIVRLIDFASMFVIQKISILFLSKVRN
jgi:GT2 family glycosyltransferase